jgi:hypothetical protein
VGPLFEHTFPPALPSELSFVGVPKKVTVLWFFEAQATWVAQVGRCRGWRRCCGRWRSTTAPGRCPTCPSASLMTSVTMIYYYFHPAVDSLGLEEEAPDPVRAGDSKAVTARCGGFPLLMYLSVWSRE